MKHLAHQRLLNKLCLVNWKTFQRLQQRNHRDLTDLLAEQQAAKEDGYLAGLSYLDTSRGTRPIIEKLPYNLEEKWLYHGSKYKQNHIVSFPTFSVLVDFICTVAKARTDPSFNLSIHGLPDRKSKWERPVKTSVYVQKTQVY